MTRSCKWLLAPLLSLIAVAQSPAAGPFDDLLKWIPEQANTLLLMDVYELHKSPLGTREDWAKKHTRVSLGATSMSPKITKVVVAAQMNPSTLQNTWEAGVFQLDLSLKQKELTRLVSGTMDSVGGKPIVLSPRNAYFVQFKEWVIGMMRPANRQAMAQWIRFARPTGRVVLTPYLMEAQETAGKEPRPQIVAAIDLSDVMDPEGLRQRLKKAKALAGKNIDIEEATKLFSGLKGVTLVIRVVDTIKGELHVDFSDRPDIIPKSVAKQLLLDAVDSMGMAIDDLDNWAADVDGRSIVLSGVLTEPGTRMMLSPLLHPATTISIENDQAESPGSKKPESAAAASQRYFRSVKTMLDDLQRQKVKTFQQQAFWYNQFAEKIDELPILNVDEDLQKYGSSVSTTLRGLSNLSTNVRLAQEQVVDNIGFGVVGAPPSSYYYGNGYGWGYGYGSPGYSAVVSNHGLSANMLSTSGRGEAAMRNQTWQNIEQATNQIRQQMTQKYQVEFK